MSTPHQSPALLRLYRLIVGVLILLLLAATSLWVFSNINMVQGIGTAILAPLFTGIGTILALLQWHAQVGMVSSPELQPLSTNQRQLHEQLFQGTLLPHKRRGVIPVYTRRGWRGATLHLLAGQREDDVPIVAAANVIARQHLGRRFFLCHFPVVPPGHYTLVAPSKGRRVQVTVYAGYVSEIDWR